MFNTDSAVREGDFLSAKKRHQRQAGCKAMPESRKSVNNRENAYLAP